MPDWITALRANPAFASMTPLVADGPDFSSLPADYVAFLRGVGSGSVGPGVLMLYGAGVEPNQVFGDDWSGSPDITLIADDFRGASFGVDGSGMVFEVAPSGHALDPVGSFREFIQRVVGSDRS